MSEQTTATPFEQGFNNNPATNPHAENSAEAKQYADGQREGELYRANQYLDPKNILGRPSVEGPSETPEPQAKPAPAPRVSKPIVVSPQAVPPAS